MDKPRERELRLEEVRKALDESDREEQSRDDSDVEAMAQKWEKVMKKGGSRGF